MEQEEKRIVMPDYSEGFRCIAGKCRHSCCIGWEIDIDEKTYEKYRTDGEVKTLKKQLVTLKNHRVKYERTNGSNIGYMQQMETRFWPWNLLSVEDDAVRLSPWFVALDVRDQDFDSCRWLPSCAASVATGAGLHRTGCRSRICFR